MKFDFEVKVSTRRKKNRLNIPGEYVMIIQIGDYSKITNFNCFH